MFFCVQSFSVVELEALQRDLAVSTVVSQNNFLIGANAKVDLKSGANLKDYSFLVGYKAKEATFTAETQDSLKGVKATYHHVASSTLAAAATASFPLAQAPSASEYRVVQSLRLFSVGGDSNEPCFATSLFNL